MAKSAYDRIPQLRLKGEDYSHDVPQNITLELFIEWKRGGVKRENISNVNSFQKKGKVFGVETRQLPNHVYTYDLGEVKRIFVIADPSVKDEIEELDAVPQGLK